MLKPNNLIVRSEEAAPVANPISIGQTLAVGGAIAVGATAASHLTSDVYGWTKNKLGFQPNVLLTAQARLVPVDANKPNGEQKFESPTEPVSK